MKKTRLYIRFSMALILTLLISAMPALTAANPYQLLKKTGEGCCCKKRCCCTGIEKNNSAIPQAESQKCSCHISREVPQPDQTAIIISASSENISPLLSPQSGQNVGLNNIFEYSDAGQFRLCFKFPSPLYLSHCSLLI